MALLAKLGPKITDHPAGRRGGKQNTNYEIEAIIPNMERIVSVNGIIAVARASQKRERCAGDISRKVLASQGNFIRPIGTYISEITNRIMVSANTISHLLTEMFLLIHHSMTI